MQLQVGVAVADADVHDGAAGGALSLGGLCWVGGRAGAGGGAGRVGISTQRMDFGRKRPICQRILGRRIEGTSRVGDRIFFKKYSEPDRFKKQNT